MHSRKTIGLTNKFVFEGEFQEEQNIVLGADETAKSVYMKRQQPPSFPAGFGAEAQDAVKWGEKTSQSILVIQLFIN